MASPARTRSTPRARRKALGLSLVEMIISLAITAMLLTATMVAINASFIAYASAAESASTQTSTRLVVHRLLALVRTSTAHGPLLPDSSADPPVTLSGFTLTSNYIDLVDPDGDVIRLTYVANEDMIYVTVTPYGTATATTEPLLGGVTDCTFYIQRRLDDDGVWVLDRGTVDFTVQPDDDSSLELEGGVTAPVRVIASTMPRKLESE
ncbi:MAG: prepilin-type N-terminal cleavage/methylation domain-containing protein [Planctomycetota bacterium]